MNITPEEIARLREALEIDTEPFLLYRHNLSGMLDEIERLQGMERERDACCDNYQSVAHECERLRAEVLRLQQHRTELDCRFVGQYGDSDARHCLDSESPKPCQRCELEMANESLRAEAANWHNLRPVYADAEREAAELRADLREAMELLRWASPDMGHASWDEWGGRANLLLAKHKETP